MRLKIYEWRVGTPDSSGELHIGRKIVKFSAVAGALVGIENILEIDT